MVGRNPKGVSMDSEQLKRMSADGALHLTVETATTPSNEKMRRRDIEVELDLAPGTIHKWVSEKSHHLPNLQDVADLVRITRGGRDALSHTIVQWLIAYANDGGLKYCPMPLPAGELAVACTEMGAEFGEFARAAVDAIADGEISRTEALRIRTAMGEVIAVCQRIINGVEPHI